MQAVARLEICKSDNANKHYILYYCTLLLPTGAIWWGTRGTCPLHFFRRGGHNMLCTLTFLPKTNSGTIVET